MGNERLVELLGGGASSIDEATSGLEARARALLAAAARGLRRLAAPPSIAKVETMATLIIIIAAWEEVAADLLRLSSKRRGTLWAAECRSI